MPHLSPPTLTESEQKAILAATASNPPRPPCATTEQRGGSDVDADSKQPCCTRDEGGPLGLGVQAQGPNHRMLLWPNGQGGERAGQGGINPSGECWEDERE